MLKQMNLFSNNSQKNEKKPEQGDLNSNQLDQINYAKSLNLSEEFILELEKHPEWSSTLMSVLILNIQIGIPHDEIIDFLMEYEPQDSERYEIGKDWNLIGILTHLAKDNLLHEFTTETDFKSMSCDQITWYLRFKYYNYKYQTDVLESGRVCINEITNNLDALLALMSEGNLEAVKLLERLGGIQVQRSNVSA